MGLGLNHNRRRPRKEGATRASLIECAGEIFAECGYEGASGREICERAGANAAAINYYFGGIENLYTAVVEVAYERLVTLAPILEVANTSRSAEQKLVALTELLLRTSLAGGGGAWPMRVLSREALRPSPHLELLRETKMVPKLRVVRTLIGEFVGLPVDHPAVIDACLAYLSIGVMLHIADHRAIEQAFPGFRLGNGDESAAIVRLGDFMLGGLRQIAEVSRNAGAAQSVLPSGASPPRRNSGHRASVQY